MSIEQRYQQAKIEWKAACERTRIAAKHFESFDDEDHDLPEYHEAFEEASRAANEEVEARDKLEKLRVELGKGFDD